MLIEWALRTCPLILAATIFLPSSVIAITLAETSSPSEAFHQGLHFLNKEEFSAAAAAFTESLKSGDRPEVLAARAEAYYHLRYYDRALEDISRSLQLDPNSDYSYILRAAIYDRIGKIQNAIDDLTFAININPQRSISYRMRGAGYLSTGQNEKALDDLNRAIVLGERSPAVYENRVLAYEALGRYDEAVRDLTILSQRDPSHPNVLLHRAWSYSCLRDFHNSLVDLEIILTNAPHNISARLLRAWVYLETSNYKRALEDLHYSLEHGSRSPWLFLNLAAAHYYLGNLEAAYLANDKAINLNDDRIKGDAIFQKGLFLLLQGKADDARKVYDFGCLYAIASSNADALTDAIDDIKKAIQSNETSTAAASPILELLIETKKILQSKPGPTQYKRCQSPRPAI